MSQDLQQKKIRAAIDRARASSAVGHAAYRIFEFIASSCAKSGECAVCQEEIAISCGISHRQSVHRAIQTLLDLNLISIRATPRMEGGRPAHIYSINTEAVAPANPDQKRKKQRAASPRLRKMVFRAFDYTCQECGRKTPKQTGKSDTLSVDRIKPGARGGGYTLDNVTCLCLRCNSKKKSKTKNYESAQSVIEQGSVRS